PLGDGGFGRKPLYSQGFLRFSDFYVRIGVIFKLFQHILTGIPLFLKQYKPVPLEEKPAWGGTLPGFLLSSMC
ncbi:MAG: hypothetical protein OXC84_09445, partial [Gammaproteobacteria bacterium]|nr:hypothetical protein [Gammaproteobacteria bacterium]